MNTHTRRRILGGLAGAASAAVLLHACGDDSSPTRPQDGVLRLEARSFRFSTRDILLRPGEAPVVEITSRDGLHNFTIDGLGVDADIPAGQTVSVSVGAAAEGSYPFYCAIPGHRDQGMEGVLTVRAPRPASTGSYGGGGTY